MRRQVSCGGNVAQQKSALESVEPLQCRGGPLVPRDSAERCPSPASAFRPPAAQRPVVVEDVLEMKIVERH